MVLWEVDVSYGYHKIVEAFINVAMLDGLGLGQRKGPLKISHSGSSAVVGSNFSRLFYLLEDSFTLNPLSSYIAQLTSTYSETVVQLSFNIIPRRLTRACSFRGE